MTDSQFIEIIFFALLAIFLGFRLRGVLGKRTGNEPPPERFRSGPPPSVESPAEKGEVIDIASRKTRPLPESSNAPPPGSLAAGLYEISREDPDFNADYFEQGASSAFEMVIKAFAEDDEDTLRMLLSDAVFSSFSAAIQDRRARGDVCKNRLEKILGLDLVKAWVENHVAYVTVRYASEQIFETRNANGDLVDGNPEQKVEITDLWTFSRDLRSDDPNWVLINTASPES